MKKEFPFMDLRVHYAPSVPDPEVPFIETDETSGNEVVKKLPASIFYQQFPLAKDALTLEDYLNAGVPLREVPVKLYASVDSCDYPFTQGDLLDMAQQIIEQYPKEEGNYNKEEN